MSEPEADPYLPVSRELVLNGILPWAGPRYESDVKKLVRDAPYDSLVLMVPKRLLDVYGDHAPANARMTSAQAAGLGLDGSANEDPGSFFNKIRRALGNPS